MSTTYDTHLDGMTVTLDLPCTHCNGAGHQFTHHDNAPNTEARRQLRNAEAMRDNHEPGAPYAYNGDGAPGYYGSLCEEAEARAQTLAATPYQPPTSAPCPHCHGTGNTARTVDTARALSSLFRLISDMHSESSDGYPDTLRDLLQECEAEKPGPVDGYTLREVAADAA